MSCDELRSLLLSGWESERDILNTKQVEAFCGTNLISKKSLAEHRASHAGQDAAVKSEWNRERLEQVQAGDENSGMEFGSMSLR